MNILFVCTGNTCRSPMAEALFKKLLDGREGIDVSSAGISAHPAPMSQNALRVLREYGIDGSMHRARQITPQDICINDLIITMTKSHKSDILNITPDARVYTLKEICGEKGDIKDPYGGTLLSYKNCAKEINGLLVELLKRLQTGDDIK